MSQGEVAQIERTRERQAVVARQPLGIFVATDAHFKNALVSQDLREAEGEAAERLQPHQDAQTRIRGHLQQGHGRRSAFGGDLRRDTAAR